MEDLGNGTVSHIIQLSGRNPHAGKIDILVPRPAELKLAFLLGFVV